jgi:DNA-binding protein H-NS
VQLAQEPERVVITTDDGPGSRRANGTEDEARELKARQKTQLGELVIATGANSLSAEELAGLLLVAFEQASSAPQTRAGAAKPSLSGQRGSRWQRRQAGQTHAPSPPPCGRNSAASPGQSCDWHNVFGTPTGDRIDLSNGDLMPLPRMILRSADQWSSD